jgi:hypothetical protein
MPAPPSSKGQQAPLILLVHLEPDSENSTSDIYSRIGRYSINISHKLVEAKMNFESQDWLS